MEVFLLYVRLAYEVWKTVSGWQPFERNTLGKQWARAMDSIGANLVEGDGRYAKLDGLHFFIVARGSARECRYWLDRAMERELIPKDKGECWMERLTAVAKHLNNLITYRRSRASPPPVKEETRKYDPFHVLDL